MNTGLGSSSNYVYPSGGSPIEAAHRAYEKGDFDVAFPLYHALSPEQRVIGLRNNSF